jgi:hypothetical protein
MDGNAYGYDYDNIGNRLSFNREGTQGTQSAAYAANGRRVQNDPMYGPFLGSKRRKINRFSKIHWPLFKNQAKRRGPG